MFEESTLNIVESINNQIMGITDEPSDPNKIIFLDVDGVLNAPDFFFKIQKEYDIDRKDLRIFEACSPVAMSFLRLIIRETNARIVWSSTWRNYLQGNHRERKICHC